MAQTREQAEQLRANGDPAKPVVDRWSRLLADAEKAKRDKFTKFAEEAAKFYDGNHDWMWSDDYAMRATTGGFLSSDKPAPKPTFRMTVNKPFEAVSRFGPALYHQNPNVQVSTHQAPEIMPEALGLDPSDPEQAMALQQVMLQQQQRQGVLKTHASVMQSLSNWLQHEGDKKTQSRRAITEAIVKGMSLLWTEMAYPPGSSIKHPISRYVSVDDLLIDPDARYWEDVQWIARRCCHAVNLVEEKYGLPQGVLKGTMRSAASQAASGRGPGPAGTTTKNMRGTSHDLIEYWEIYSKNGFGDMLRQDLDAKQPGASAHQQIDWSPMGRYVYLAICPSVPYPLNLPTWDLHEKSFEEVKAQTEWPIPFWADPNCDGGWPFSRLYFFEHPDHVWPISIFKPVTGELRFLNWCMSFLADKVAACSTTYLSVLKESLGDIEKNMGGQQLPYHILALNDITGKGKLSDVIQFLDAPAFHADIWRMVAEVMELIDKRTGLTELAYGLSHRQLRSAQEANVKDQATSIIPDDMASKTEDFLSATAAKEMQAMRWHCGGEDVGHVVGEAGAFIWDEQIRTSDFDQLVRDFNFRIEAGSARKPNKAARGQRLTELGQVILPILQELAAAGQVEPWNAYIRDVCRNLDLDPEPYMLQPPPPPEQQGPSEEEVQMELEARRQQLMMELEEIQHQQQMQHDEERHDQEMEFTEEKNRLELGRLQAQKRLAASRSQ